jgi:uncharacterized SAM-binding protein YcdF (DUF218 family)
MVITWLKVKAKMEALLFILLIIFIIMLPLIAISLQLSKPKRRDAPKLLPPPPPAAPKLHQPNIVLRMRKRAIDKSPKTGTLLPFKKRSKT